MLEKACRECQLKPGPDPEAVRVLDLASLPDGALDFRSMPYWLVNGIGVYRTMNRGGF